MTATIRAEEPFGAEIVGALVGRAAAAQCRAALGWATQPRFIYRHLWHRGDLIVGDNTGMLHPRRPPRGVSCTAHHARCVAAVA